MLNDASALRDHIDRMLRESVTGNDGGYVIPVSVIDPVMKFAAWIPYTFERELSWEERLAEAIERRTLRGRIRSLRTRWSLFRWDWQQRLSLAYDALRDRHECDY